MTKDQTIKELQAELDRAWHWISILGKINHELLEYVMEKKK